MRYLIDTHIIIWAAKERWKLTPNVKAILEDYEMESFPSIVTKV